MAQAARQSNRRGMVAGGITLVACALLALGVMLLFPACGPKDDGTWMSCHTAQMAVFGLACVMVVLAAIALFVRGGIATWLHAAVALLAVVAAIVPGSVIPLCMMEGMQCRSVMRPSVILFSVIIAACAVVSVLLERGRRQS